MKKTTFFIVALASTLVLSGCGNNAGTSSTDSASNIQSYTNPSFNNGLVSHPFILTDESLIPCPFISNGDSVYFPNWNDENRISKIAKTSLKSAITINDITDFVNYSTSSLALINDTLYFADSSNSNNLSSVNFTDKSYKLLSESNISSLLSVNNLLYYINGSDNHNLYTYDTNTNKELIVSKTKIGKYMINGDFILFQNMDDNMKLYKMRLDGSESEALSDFSVDSFVVYNGIILAINTSDNNYLYKIDPTTLDSTRLFLMNGENLKCLNNKIYYINFNDSNYLHSLNVTLENSAVTSTVVLKDPINDYYLNDYGIFIEKAIDVNHTYFLNY